MADEPGGLATKLWRASLTILGATLALWLSVRLLLEIWCVLAIAGAIIAGAAILLRWWQWRRW
ncbi:MAG: hypothetical protein KKA32_06885 [Actinobacteria bacterium]|nr:hypothetical protein [Actinomycetota bacterium]